MSFQRERDTPTLRFLAIFSEVNVAYRTVGKALPRVSAGQDEEKPVKQKFFLRFLGFQSDNLKSKIEKIVVGLFAIVVAFTLCGAVARGAADGKIFRIGFLDP